MSSPPILESGMKNIINRNAKTHFESDAKKALILKTLKDGGLTSKELSDRTKLNWHTTKHIINNMVYDGLLVKSKILCEVTKRYLCFFESTGIEFYCRTYEECLEGLSEARQSAKARTRGKFDDLIDANPNLRKFHGKTSLMDTKTNDYFQSAQRSHVNRGISSTWGMFDAASGFD